jgi:hypothetical protein
MKTFIKTPHGIAILGTCLIIAIVFVNWASKQIDLINLSVLPLTQTASLISSGSATFGNSTASGGSFLTSSRTICTGPFFAPDNGNIQSISVYGSEPSGATVSVAIYGDSGTSPKNFLAASFGTVVAPTSAGWVTIPIEYTMTSGESYYLCTWANGPMSYLYTAVTDFNTVSGQLTTWPTWNSTYSVNTRMVGRELSIYATYTPGAGTPLQTDITPPSVPTGLTVSNVQSTQATISWIASTDNTAVSGYKIFRNGTQVGTSNTTSFTDTGLTAETTYLYTVSAYDTASPANESSRSTSDFSVTTSAAGTMYTLIVSKGASTGSGTVTGPGITCGSDCSETVNTGTSITLTATPASGSTFTGWSGGGCSGTGTCIVVLNTNIIVIATFNVTQASTGNWYVDANASGTGTGLSWNDAWKTFGEIDWTKVQAGNTVWVSGGVYNESANSGVIVLSKGGTQGFPITIKASQDVGHNGKIYVNGRISVRANWITIDGAKSDSYAVNVIGDNTFKVPLVKDNINWKIDSSSVSNVAIIVTTGGIGNVFKWLEVTTGIGSEQDGIRFNLNIPYELNYDEIGYSWIHNTGQDGIILKGNSGPLHWDAVKVHHSFIENIGDDGITLQPGMTVHNSVVGPSLGLNGHPDGIIGQTSLNKIRVYNNIVYNWYSNMIGFATVDPLSADVQVYGNLVYNTANWPIQTSEALIFSVDPYYDISRPDGTLSNVVIANNTLIGGSNCIQTKGICDPANFANPLSSTVTIHPKNMHIENNILYNGYGKGIYTKGWLGTGYQYAPNDLILDYNNIWSATKAGNRIGYLNGGVPYIDVNAFNSAHAIYGYSHNIGIQPKFVSVSGLDFSLAIDDMAAKDKGVDLSFLGLPGIDKDLAGNQRGQGGIWDIGALEYTGTSYQLDGSIVVNPTYILSVNKSGSGAGTVTATGISCGQSCSTTVNEGISLTLAAVPDPDSIFVSWSGCTTVAGQVCNAFVGADNVTITATFARDTSSTVPQMLLHLDFNQDWQNGIAQDSSSFGNNATCQQGYYVDNDSTKPYVAANQCPANSQGPDESVAPRFTGSTCDVGSDYFGVNLSNSLNNLSKGTIALWVNYENNSYDNAKLLDSLLATSNTWSLGQSYLNHTVFIVKDDAGLQQRPVTFPDTSASHFQWHHYAVTWDKNKIKGYFDGIKISESSQAGISKLSLGKYLAIGASEHGASRNLGDDGVTCVKNGFPAGNYVYPNNGFFIGRMDDIRIYNGALSDSDVVTLASQKEPSDPTLGDFNHDGLVNSIDLSLLTSYWNQNNATYDLNTDGVINSLDYDIMVQNWSV